RETLVGQVTCRVELLGQHAWRFRLWRLLEGSACGGFHLLPPRVTERQVPERDMLLALGYLEIAGAQGVFDGQRQAHLPGIAVQLAGGISQGTTQFVGDKATWGCWWQPFQRPCIELADEVNRVEQRLIARGGGKGQVQKVGKIFAETGIAVQEQIAVSALFKPLTFSQVVAGDPPKELCYPVLRQLVRRGMRG